MKIKHDENNNIKYNINLFLEQLNGIKIMLMISHKMKED